MLFFSHRKKLGDLYLEWIDENDLLDCPQNMVLFMQINGLLNEDKAREMLGLPVIKSLVPEGVKIDEG
jgi:hypothetical protein